MAREVIEITPLVSKPAPKPFQEESSFLKTLHVLGLIGLWYFFSTLLSLLNKLILGHHGVKGKGKFPAPLLMTGTQFFVQFILARLLLDLGVVHRAVKHEEITTWSEYFQTVVPNGVSTGLDIGFSNLSLRFISLSFYTMCKSTTPIFLLLFAFVWGIEKPSCSLFGIVLVIASGILLLVYGEAKFNLTGFTLVMTAACLAGLRWTLTQVLLQGNQRPKIRNGRSHSYERADVGAEEVTQHPKEGPLDLLEKLTPRVVLLVSVSVERWDQLSKSPYFHDFEQCILTFAGIVVLGLIAFLMVWTEFKVIKETSALTFMVAGTCKEVVTVMAAVVFFHDVFGLINLFGLLILLFGVSLFNVYKYQKMKANSKLPLNHGPRRKNSEPQELTLLRSESHHAN